MKYEKYEVWSATLMIELKLKPKLWSENEDITQWTWG